MKTGGDSTCAVLVTYLSTCLPTFYRQTGLYNLLHNGSIGTQFKTLVTARDLRLSGRISWDIVSLTFNWVIESCLIYIKTLHYEYELRTIKF